MDRQIDKDIYHANYRFKYTTFTVKLIFKGTVEEQWKGV